MKSSKLPPEIRSLYTRFRANPPFIRVGFGALDALDAARTVARFRELEAAGLVRITAEPEQENYFSVFGEPDTEKERKKICDLLDRWGCYYVATEYLIEGEWESGDSVGMCVYKDPCSPFENCYVVQMMAEVVEKAQRELSEPAERLFWEQRDSETKV